MININNPRFYNILIYLSSILFSLHIFFWGIDYNFIKPRFFIFLLFFFIIFNLNKKILKKLFKYFLISLIIFFHLFFQSKSFFLNNLYFIIGLFLILIISDFYEKIFLDNLNKIIYFFLIIFFLFLIFQFLFQYINTSEISNICIGCFSYYRIFFKENSHLAIIAPSVIFYLLFMGKFNKLNIFFLISFIIICFINPTLTLYIGIIFFVILVFFLKLKKNNYQKFILIFLSLLVSHGLFTNKTSQVKMSDIPKILSFEMIDKNTIYEQSIEEHNAKRSALKKINLSAEIYKTSLLILKKAILHKPFGYGFNNYNEAFNQFIKDIDVYNWETKGLNTKDGSNTFVKIVVEFGILSLLFFYFLISFFFNRKINNQIKIFLILPIAIQLCIRGVGYFNGGFLLFSMLAFILLLKVNSRNSLKL